MSKSNEKVSSHEQQKPKGKKKLKYLLILVVLLIAGATGGIYWYSQHHHPQVKSALLDFETEKMTAEELKKYATQKVDESNVTIQVYPKISVKSDGKSATMWVQNLPINKTGQEVTLKDKSTGKVLYQSGVLKPGYQTSQITLKEKLSSGSNEGIVTLSFYDLDKSKQVGQTDVEVTLNVEA